MILFRPKRNLDAVFSGYAFDCPQSQHQKSTMGRGFTVMHIYSSELKYLWIGLPPPLDEQRAIAHYLDHVDRCIQRYIEAKEQLIALLQEARQAIIQRAVTRGLDPAVPLKPSGVDWLGDVPAHWEVARLKGHVANIADMTNECCPDEIYLALENIKSWTGKLREVRKDVRFDSQVKRFRVGDVLFGKLRPYLAKVTSPSCKGVCVGEFLVLRCLGETFLPGYLERLMRSKPVIDAINASTFGAKMPRADWQFIGSMKYPLPPLSEQTVIAAHLGRATAAIDNAIDNARCQVEFIREYRASLIAHVVTGKLDVRAAAAQLPADSPAETPVPEQEKSA